MILSVIITLIGGIDTDELIEDYGTIFEKLVFLAVYLIGSGLIVSISLKNKYKKNED